MNIDELLGSNLNHHITKNSPQHPAFADALKYGVLPAGKLFRPKLACAIFEDNSSNSAEEVLKRPAHELSLCASALEIHHAYTLIHDDLPCMDDDDFRRGRPSLHKAFGEWQAVLAGDSLLHLSHALVGKINTPHSYQIRALFNWALGAKGLILGQVYDLGGEIHNDFNSLVTTHTLKTARLIQASLYCGLWCSQEKPVTYRQTIDVLRFGEALGVGFQLLDDLTEGVEDLSEHEKQVNPFINFPAKSFQRLDQCLSRIRSSSFLKDGGSLDLVIKKYFEKMKLILEKDLQREDSYLIKSFTEDDFNIDSLNKICDQLT